MGDRRRLTIALTAVIALAIAVGLGWGVADAFSAGSPSPAAAGKVVLKIGWTNDPDNLNPFIGTENSSYEIWAINYDFLFGFGRNDQPVPDIATEIPTVANGGISADGKIWTVHIRPNVKWQDGQPLTAEDVAWTYNYIIDNQMYAFSFMTAGIKELKVVDPTTVQIVCDQPKADMLRLWIPILPKHVWQDVKPRLAENSYQLKPPIVGSGPFQVVEVKRGSHVTMERNPSYWGPRPAVDEILFETYQNADTMTQDLRTGMIDAAQGVPAAQFKMVQNSAGLTAIAYNYLNWDYLCFNCYTGKSLGNPVLKDAAFRQALNYAIDQQKIVNVAFSGYAKPGTTICPPDSWSNPDYHWQPPASMLYTFDLAKAKSMLDAAGYRDTNGDGTREDKSGKPIKLQLYGRSESASSQAEGKLLTGWFRQVGLDVQYDVIDDGSLEDKVWNYQGNTFVPDFDMYLWDWDGYVDPGQTLSCYSGPQIEGWNEPAWADPRFDKLNVEQFRTLDQQKRVEQIRQMQEIMYEQSPQITLTYPQYLQAYNTGKWTGWTRILNGNGPVIYCAGNIDTYLNLKPIAAGKKSSSVNTTLTIVVVVVLLAACAAVLAWWLLRRRPQVEES